MKGKVKLLLGIAILSSVIFYQFGRSLWYPKYVAVKGKETIDSVKEKVGNEVWKRLERDLDKASFKEYPPQLKILAFKEERLLEVYGQNGAEWQFIKSYPFTKFSGTLGPKLKEGDRQIPEGIYQIEYLNPNSSYYLSAKVSYPNEWEKSIAKTEARSDIGSDIFIHGKAATVGCIPIGDTAIEEVFLLMQHALNNGIEVIISPRDFRTDPTIPDIETVTWYPELCEKIKARVLSIKK